MQADRLGRGGRGGRAVPAAAGAGPPRTELTAVVPGHLKPIKVLVKGFAITALARALPVRTSTKMRLELSGPPSQIGLFHASSLKNAVPIFPRLAPPLAMIWHKLAIIWQ